jgi:hypothetical protein
VRSYQWLTEEFHRIDEAFRSAALLAPTTKECDEVISEARRVGIGWDNAMAAVWLYGSHGVVAAARTADDQLTELFLNAQRREFSPDEWEEESRSSRDAFENFVDQVRKDLGLPTLGVRLYWTPRS